jgi:hypothetical protein
VNDIWLFQSQRLLFDELSVILQEIFDNKILDNKIHILHIVVIYLSQIISILLLSHLESLQIILTRIVNQTGEVHGPEEN